MKHDTIHEAVRAAPPVGVAGLGLWGISINEVLILLTILYTIFLIVDKLPAVLTRAREFIQWVKGLRNDKESD